MTNGNENEYTNPPWPGDIDLKKYNIDPQATRLYYQPPFVLGDGKMAVRVFIQAYDNDGLPAIDVPLVFADHRNRLIFGEGVEALRQDRVTERRSPFDEKLVITGDEDDGYSPYLALGAWTDSMGQWEGFIRLAKQMEDDVDDQPEILTLNVRPVVGGRRLFGPYSRVFLRFGDVDTFEAFPSLMEFWADQIDEAEFEGLARALYGKRGELVDSLPNRDPEE